MEQMAGRPKGKTYYNFTAYLWDTLQVQYPEVEYFEHESGCEILVPDETRQFLPWQSVQRLCYTLKKPEDQA